MVLHATVVVWAQVAFAWPNLAIDSVEKLELPVSAIVYSSFDGKVYCSIPSNGGIRANTVTQVDPVTGVLGGSIRVSNNPGKLVASDDGRFIYVVSGDGNRIEKLNLETGVVALSFSLGDSFLGPVTAYDIAVMPGRSSTVAVACGGEVRIYDDSTPRLQKAISSVTSIEFSTNSAVIFGVDRSSFYPISVTPAGAVLGSIGSDQFEVDGDIASSGGLVFSTSKGIFDPNTLVMRFPFYGRSGFGYRAALAVDTAARRVCYVLRKESFVEDFRFQIFNLDTCLPVGEISVPSRPGYFTGTLIRWGQDGLAYHADTNQVIFLRTSLLPVAPAADLVVRQWFVPAAGASKALLHCSVENRGPNPAQEVKLRVDFGGPVSLIGDFGEQDVGTTNNFIIEFNAPLTNTILATAAVSSLSTDPVTGNNTSLLMLAVPGLAGSGAVFTVPLQVADLVADPVGGGIFLAVDRQVPNLGNGVVYFDPKAGTFSHSTFVGTDIHKLVVSPDRQKLYASSAEKITELNPASLQVLRSLSMPANSVASEITVFPDDANRLAVWLNNLPSRLGEVRAVGLGVYTNGALAATNWQTFFGSRQIAITQGSDFLNVFRQRGGLSIDLFAVAGPVLTNFSSIEDEWLDFRGEIRAAHDRLYAPYGGVYDLVTRRVLGTYNVPGIDGWPQSSAGPPLVAPDLENGRVFFLRYTGSGTEVRLHSFDAARYQGIGSMVVPGVIQPPERLIRWGSDGLAFKSDKLHIVRSALVPSGANADLAIRLSGGSNPGRIGQSEAYSLTITNRGPEAATGIVAVVTFSPNGIMGDIASSQGITTLSNLVMLYDVGSLAVGATASMNFTFNPTVPGVFQLTSSVSGKCRDPNLSNDTSAHLELIVGNESSPPIAQLTLPVSDVVSDRTNLFASLHEFGGAIGNSVVKIDPVSGRIVGPVFVGSRPNRLAVSGDGSTLYVGVDGASSVQELNANTLELRTSFGISNGLRADVMEVVPTTTHQLLICQNPAGLSFYDHGVETGNKVKNVSTFVFDDISGDAFGFDRGFSLGPLYRLLVNSNGVEIAQTLPATLQQSHSDLKAQNGLLYYDRGLVVSAALATETQRFAVNRFSEVRVQPAADRQLVYFLTGPAGGWSIRAFSGDGQPFGMHSLPELRGTPGRIARWGNTGLAFATSLNQLFLLRDQFTSDIPAADVAVHRLVAPRTALPGSSLTYVCIITNHSAAVASSTVVTQSFELSGRVQQTEVSAGSVQVTGPRVRWNVGNLAPYGSAQIRVRLAPPFSSQTITNQTSVASSAFDPSPANNLARAATTVRAFGTNTIVTMFDLSVADLVYDPATKLLWASVTNAPSGSVVVPIDPIEGVVGPGIDMGTETTRLGVDPYGTNLYCLQPFAGRVVRMNASSQRVDQFTSIGSDAPVWQYSTPLDVAVSPATPGRIAVSYSSSDLALGKSVSLIDDGVVQPRTAASSAADVIEFDEADDQVYGFNNTSSGFQLNTLAITNGGLVLTTERSGLISGFDADIKRGGSRLFGSSGRVADPRNHVLITNLPSSITATAVEPVQSDGRVYYATKTPYSIRALSLTNFALLGTNLLTGISGDVRGLVRWGVNGLALHTTGGQVVILRSSLVPAPVGQDTDMDGTPDEWESRFGFNPYDNVDAAMDLDSDGLSNYAEYQAGTDPHNASSSLRIKRVFRQGGTFGVVFPSVGGRTYRLEGRSELSGSSLWQIIVEGIPGTGGDVTNFVPVTSTNRFVRVRTQP